MADGYSGQMGLTDDGSDFNKISFLVRQMIGRLSTATLVQVKAVTNSGGVAPVGSVDVLPLVNMLDGVGNSYPHGTVYKLPYFRLQGGANAVILDPVVGDLGLAVFADRDISSVKANKAQSNPGSRRRFDMADGLYLGGFLNGTPDQYVRFFEDGVHVYDKNGNKVEMTSAGTTITDKNSNKIEMTSSGLKVTDKFGHFINMNSTGIDMSGDVTTTGTLKNNGVNVGSTHVHAGVQAGGSNTAVPH